MSDRGAIGRRMREHFEGLWARGDPWDLEGSEFERAKYARQLALIEDRRYARALEIGCGSGRFTGLLTRIADDIVAVDIAPAAIARARDVPSRGGTVSFRVANIMDYDIRREGPWDLVVLSETVYCLGWLYSVFDVGWLAAELLAGTRPGGRLLMANAFGGAEDYLLSPWLIRTYRDLLLNVGYRLETEEVFRGVKNGVEVEALISLFFKPRGT